MFFITKNIRTPELYVNSLMLSAKGVNPFAQVLEACALEADLKYIEVRGCFSIDLKISSSNCAGVLWWVHYICTPPNVVG